MSLLRPSITGRLLRASVPIGARATPACVRYDSQSAAGTPLIKSENESQPLHRSGESTMENASNAKDTQVSHNKPMWNAEVDQASSRFSPVPRRVMDGSEKGEVLPAAVLSGAPIELQARTVRIFCPSKPATQSGEYKATKWRMDWDVLPKGHRWEWHLMGWQSSADFMQGTAIEFDSRDAAIAFAEKQGYEYFVQEPNERKRTPKAYANNFLYSDKKLKHIRTK